MSGTDPISAVLEPPAEERGKAVSTVPWSEENLKARVAARAVELKTSVPQLLINAGLDRTTLAGDRTTGRRIDTLERIATACGWTLPELLGFSFKVEYDTLTTSARLAHLIMQGWGMKPVPITEEELQRHCELTADMYNEILRRPTLASDVVEQQRLVDFAQSLGKRASSVMVAEGADGDDDEAKPRRRRLRGLRRATP